MQAKVVVFRSNNAYPRLSSGVDIHVTGSSRHHNLIRSRDDYADYRNLLNAFDPDVIHTHLYEAESFAKGCIHPRAVYFTHFHGRMPKYRKLRLNTFFSRHQLAHYILRQRLLKAVPPSRQHFIAIAQNSYHYIVREIGTKWGGAHLLHNAIDLKRFVPVRAVGSFPQQPVLLNIGRFAAQKNQGFLLDVMSCLRNRGMVQARLILVGEGPLKEGLVARADAMQLNEFVEFRSWNDEPEAVLGPAFLYTHSAVYEPFGLVLVEAMACGIPVLALDALGNRDVVLGGINGYMFPKADAEVYAARIEELWADREQYSRLAKGAYETSRKFGIEDYVTRLLHIYEEAIARAQ